MATEKIINIVVNKDKADKSTKELKNSFDNLGDSVEKSNKIAEESVNKLDKSNKKANKSVGFLRGGFKKLGTAIKATGIGLVVSLVAALTAALAKNQRVVNAVNSVFETVGIVLSQVGTALVNVYDSVSKSSENFNGLGKVMSGLLTIAITPFKTAWFGIKLAIQQTQLAWEKSVFGGKDKDTIKQLTLDVLETQKALLETGKKALQSGKDIVNNFSDAISEVGAISTKVGEEIGKISIKSAIEQGKINTQLKNSALLAAAQQQLLVEKYDILAEKQRQIRDEERNTIDERIKANNELGSVLEMQEKAMLETANAQIASAQAELNKNNTIEAQVALTEALANKQGVLAQVEGFRSEQLVNDLALKKEQIELDNTISDKEKQRQLDKLDFEAEIALNEATKNEKLQERLDLENEILLEDLERKRELYREGTIARIEAEQEYLDLDQELKQKQLLLTNKIEKEKVEIEDNANKSKEKSSQALEDAKINLAQNGLAVLGQLAKRGSAVAKSIAVAQAGISTYQGINKALAETTDPTPTQSLRFANAAAVGIAGLLNVQKIISTNESGSISSAQVGGQGGGAQAPSFNLVRGTQQNQLNETLNASSNRPVEAFVVSGNMTTAQQADRNKIDEGSI
tara:strand:- start:177 stop:2069 length:1893 start_codon:yes stop_codon:yes gene_type:complete